MAEGRQGDDVEGRSPCQGREGVGVVLESRLRGMLGARYLLSAKISGQNFFNPWVLHTMECKVIV